MEIWKQVSGYEGDYEVSNLGEIKSLKTNIILKGSFGKGYLHVGLCKKGARTILRIHRLVALNFIPNPQNKAMVNHKNGIKTDNRVENLEWVTGSENQLHAHRTGLKNSDHTKTPVIDIVSGKEYTSITDAAKEVKYSRSHLARMLSGVCKNKTTFQFNKKHE